MALFDLKEGKNMNASFHAQKIWRIWALALIGLVYLVLVAIMFITGADIAADAALQTALHITLILTAVAYVLFADAIYAGQKGEDARLLLIFAALFAVPVLLGRGIGLAYLQNPAMGDVWNFYGAVSVSRAVEMVSWTVLFPFSMLYLSRLFFKQKSRFLGWAGLFSAVCCFIAFLTFFSDAFVFLFIGLAGWGFLFELIVIVYLIGLLKGKGA